MPMRQTRSCEQYPCEKLAVDGRRCADHKKEQGKADYAARGTLQQRGYPANWNKLRAFILARDPICKGCENALSNECDHRLPLERGGSNDPENLQGLCQTCHSRKTRIEQEERDPDLVMQRVRAAAAIDRPLHVGEGMGG